MCTGELLGKPDEMLVGGGPCDGLASHPGGVVIIVLALC